MTRYKASRDHGADTWAIWKANDFGFPVRHLIGGMRYATARAITRLLNAEWRHIHGRKP